MQKSRTTFREEVSRSEMGFDALTGVARTAKENRELDGYLNAHLENERGDLLQASLLERSQLNRVLHVTTGREGRTSADACAFFPLGERRSSAQDVTITNDCKTLLKTITSLKAAPNGSWLGIGTVVLDILSLEKSFAE